MTCPTCGHALVRLPLTPGVLSCTNGRCIEYFNQSTFCIRCGERHPKCSCRPAASNWDKRFIGLAAHFATWSKDESTKVGCVLIHPATRIVIGTGFNGFPRSVKHETDRNARPAKYLFTVHAEANALFNAARRGNATEGAWAYVNWDPRESICAGCAGALIQSGIGKIIGPASTVQGRTDIPDDSGWRASCRVGVEMLGEAGVEVLGL